MFARWLMTMFAVSLIGLDVDRAKSEEAAPLEDRLTADRLEDARYTLWRMLDSRAQLVSGRCEIAEEAEEETPSVVAPPMRRFGMRNENSFDPMLVVFDFQRPGYRQRQTYQGDYLVDSDFRYVAEYSPDNARSESPSIPIRRYLLAEVTRSNHRPFDIRNLGFISPYERHVTPENLDFKKTREEFLASRVVEFEREDDLLVLTIEVPKREGGHFAWQRRFWIDPAKGYTTTAVGNPRTSGPTVEMEWTEVNGVWVIDSITPYRQPKLKFTWEDVNQEISGEEFQLERIIPEGYRGRLYRIDPFTHDRIEMGMVP